MTAVLCLGPRQNEVLMLMHSRRGKNRAGIKARRLRQAKIYPPGKLRELQSASRNPRDWNAILWIAARGLRQPIVFKEP